MQHASVDIAIFGGGIAGLWLLTRLRQLGFSALLFETHSLGGGQTNKAQGIIHAGMKYALAGQLTSEAHAMHAMPQLWNACLQGHGEIDLSHVPVLSHQHYLFAPTKFTAKLTGLLAQATLKSDVLALKKNEYPPLFLHPQFKGEVFALGEFVIDVPALVLALTRMNQEAIFKCEPAQKNDFTFDAKNNLSAVVIHAAGKSANITAQQFIFTAGLGNEIILDAYPECSIHMQKRPLHMVMAKLPFDCPLYAHCLGLGSKPRLTITTHYTHDGSPVWYLGGQLAEEGVQRDTVAQIKAAREELTGLFPWLDFSRVEWSAFRIDRAEPKQVGGLKPDSAYVKAMQNVMVAWPTKLALAPQLAAEAIQLLQHSTVQPQPFHVRELHAWPMPALAKPIWEEAFCEKIS